jgi:DNA repair exonuclease SbcCD ATPase subunit
MLIAFNRVDQAITQLTKTTAEDPKDGISWLNLGLLYENKASGFNEEIRKIQDKLTKVQEVDRRLAAQNDQISAFQDEVKRTKAKLKTATTPKAKASVNNQVTSLEAKLKELADVLKGIQEEKAAATAAAGDAATNKARIDELSVKVKDIRATLPNYYLKALEIDANNYDALYQMGAYYYNDAVVIKTQLNGMELNEYKKTGKDFEAKLAVKYNEALPFFERGFKIKKDEDLKEILRQVYRELKDEAKLAELEK